MFNVLGDGQVLRFCMNEIRDVFFIVLYNFKDSIMPL